jgi:hypothetical protein
VRFRAPLHKTIIEPIEEEELFESELWLMKYVMV